MPTSDEHIDCKLVRVLSALCCETWLITPEMHKTLTDIARNHAFGGRAEAEQHAAAESMPAKPAKRRFALVGRTAVIPVEGTIGRKFSSALYSSGVTSIDVLDRILQSAAIDDEVNSILLSFDSPGGLATGVPELGARIRQIRDTKPVVAFADGLTASAAYWMAAQADVVFATESAQVGSIGVYIALLDVSRYAEMEGLRVEVFKSGKHKAMGYPGTSLTDEQRAMLQARVDELGAKFRAAVREGRARAIDDDVMQGQSFGAEAAVANGLIDQVTDFDTALRAAGQLGEMRARRMRK